MKKFNIGTSDFSTFINKGYAYVDKTAIIYNLINETMGAQFFLSRPRRFGKSLLLSTIKCIFEGKKELFSGLKIENLWKNWDETYPVLHLNMNECTGSIERVKKIVQEQLDRISNQFKIDIDRNITLSGQFNMLIRKLALTNNNNQIVLLLDEYDKPMLDHIGKEEVSVYQTFLKEFYTVIKDTDKYQRFTLITGVSKFSHVSIFSGLNNLIDLTMDPNTSTLLGYTHKEMHENFKENIEALGKKNNVTYEEIFQKLVEQYDGYCFDENMIPVFNPVSIGNCLSKLIIKNYWFATGTPGWLIEYLKSKPFFLNGKIEITDTKLNSYDPKNPDVLNLLLQTGYLTIVNSKYDFDGYVYTLDFPNNEVRLGFSEWLVNGYITEDDNLYRQIRRNFRNAIINGNAVELIDFMKQFYSTIPYDIQDKMKVEQAYQLSIVILLMYLGFDVHAETRTNKGRIDILIEAPNFVYIIELKLDKSAQSAIDQIHKKAYYEQFKSQNKKIILLGISFSSKEKNITDYTIEEVK